MALLLAFVLFSGILGRSAFAYSAITKDSTFPRPSGDGAIGASGNVMLDPATRRGYRISRLETTVLTEFDLDTLQVLRTTDIPKISEAPAQRSTDWMWALDTVHNQMHFLIDTYEGSLETKKLVSLDLGSLKPTDPLTLWPNADSVPLSFTYHQESDRYYMLVRNQADALGALLQVEERSFDGTLIGQHRLSSCFGALDFHYSPTTSRSSIDPSVLYVDCYNSSGIQSQVVRIHLGTNSQLDDVDPEDVFPAVPGPLSTIFDPGSDRIFFLTANKGAGRGAWVFDGLKSSFLGVIATGDTEAGQDYSIGLDQTSGRIYMQTPAGLVVADARRTPLPSGLIFKDFAGNGYGRVSVDPVIRRLFVPDASDSNASGLPQRYQVLRDGIALSVDPKPGNPDTLTTDVDEKDGRTDVNLAAGGSAFGLRSLTTGGLQRGVWNLALGNTAPEDLPSIDTTLSSLPIDPGNRDLFVSRVSKVSMADAETEASVIPIAPDDATLGDFRNRSVDWPFTSTTCTDSEGNPAHATGDHDLAGVSCDSKAKAVWGSAGSGTLESPQDLKVRSTFASSSIYRDPTRGLVANSQAILRGISIGPSIRIGELRTIAETWARGRPGKAHGSFTRTINDVQIDTNQDGVFDVSCQDACDLNQALSAMASTLAGKASITFPEPDDTFKNGSPGGFQAVIQKQRFLSYSERSLNDDDSPEVVGIEIIYYGDAKAGRSRQVFQLAGVQAESHYGIYLLPTNESVFSDPAADPVISFAPGSSAIDGSEITVDPLAASAGEPGHSIFDKIIKRVLAGWRLFRSRPGDAAMMVITLTFLLLPIYMIQRRRFVGAAG
ncbi:MAG: hypothetical protein ABR507_11240 [Actinomycetota bacterium]